MAPRRREEPRIKTRLAELFGIRHPLVQGGMHCVGFAGLAAAVSDAGGLGTSPGSRSARPQALVDRVMAEADTLIGSAWRASSPPERKPVSGRSRLFDGAWHGGAEFADTAESIRRHGAGRRD